jgi:hypothetical protein
MTQTVYAHINKRKRKKERKSKRGKESSDFYAPLRLQEEKMKLPCANTPSSGLSIFLNYCTNNLLGKIFLKPGYIL